MKLQRIYIKLPTVLWVTNIFLSSHPLLWYKFWRNTYKSSTYLNALSVRPRASDHRSSGFRRACVIHQIVPFFPYNLNKFKNVCEQFLLEIKVFFRFFLRAVRNWQRVYSQLVSSLPLIPWFQLILQGI